MTLENHLIGLRSIFVILQWILKWMQGEGGDNTNRILKIGFEGEIQDRPGREEQKDEILRDGKMYMLLGKIQ